MSFVPFWAEQEGGVTLPQPVLIIQYKVDPIIQLKVEANITFFD